ncbi:GNAT family N-acetyltransferase [Veronia pacifica]|uniref:N-acetyltransferase domain-containing protein n=1 Tax=Veronia pacifica TaxID=1080227 RepID=A0A1C3EPE5_9GAMM|nr:GNAT family N-acetyltransferase [Veronia pacifica]ODA35110.1 hypothetical protein A8L45_05380 [Veronia pacifica]
MFLIQPCSPDVVPLPLLLEADPCKRKIQGYLDQSQAWVVREGEVIIGACLTVQSNECIEIMNLSVLPEKQQRGVGRRLLEYVISHLQQQSSLPLVLGTGSFGHQLAFYQRLGFRLASIERDFFLKHYSEPLIEEGIQHRDMIRMKYEGSDRIYVDGFNECFSFQKATDDDIPFLYALRKITMTRYLEEAGMPCDEVSHLKRIKSYFEHADLIHYQGDPVGLFKVIYSVKENYWYLVQIQILPEYQGKGLGRAILQRLLLKAARHGEDVHLSVITSSPAMKLYKSMGFEEFGVQGSEILLRKIHSKINN